MAVGRSLGSSLEEINAVAARVIEGVVGPGSDANHAAFGNRLLLFLFTTEGFHVGVDAASGELKAKLLSAAGGEQTVDVEPRKPIDQDQRRGLGVSSSPMSAELP